MRTSRTNAISRPTQHLAGFTLLEILVAITLGLLLSIGILGLFSGTSHTNKLQDGLARLQENGRFAVSRIENDVRMLGAQVCSNNTGNASNAADGTPYWAARAPMVYMTAMVLPDYDGPPFSAGPLDPQFFVQGYECSTGGCASLLALGAYSSESVAADQRVPNSDVLIMRYQQGTGWPIVTDSCGTTPGGQITPGETLTLAPQIGDDPLPPPIPAPSAVLISNCSGSAVFPITSFTAGAPPTVTFGAVAGNAPGSLCRGSATSDARLFDFSNFGTVSYFLVYRNNNDPDAGGRLIPTLVRRDNGGAVVDLVQGVDQIDFVYGVLDALGSTHFMTAAEIDAAAVGLCVSPPDGGANNAGCLWRSLRSVEVHLLVNSTRELSVDDVSRSFTYMGTTTSVASNGSTLLRSGQAAGSMMRREFVSQTMIRNRNP